MKQLRFFKLNTSLIALLKLDGNVIMLTNTHTYLEEDDVIKDEKVRMEKMVSSLSGVGEQRLFRRLLRKEACCK